MTIHRQRVLAALVLFAFTGALRVRGAEPGHIVGTIRFTGPVPRKSVADNLGRRRPLLQVDGRSKGLRSAVVFLDGVRTPAMQAKGEAVVDQRDETFVPHMVSISEGMSVRFKNGDSSNHNVHALGLVAKNQFNVLTPEGQDYVHRFVPEKKNRPIVIRCDIHAWMNAWVYVFPHPFHAVTNARGEFKIEKVPVGRHRLVVRQPDGGLKFEKIVDVEPGKGTRVEVTLTDKELRIPK